jgi:hypothetical protein
VVFFFAEGWCLHTFPSREGAVYHPFSGELYALSALPSALVCLISEKFFERAPDLANVLAAIHARGISAETLEIEVSLEELLQLGVIVSAKL